jgi:TP901 family phage tail tape measure protein
MSGSVYELAILLSLKDLASGGLDRVEARLRAAGKEGRATLQTFQDLRRNLKQDLVVAGVGLGMLKGLQKGVDVAGDFEAATSDLTMRLEEMGTDGRVNVQKLTSELGKLEALGVNVGNRLPGTTEDFIQMFSVLKEGGLEAKTIIDGAGEGVANLAVVTNEIPKDLAEPFAQYAQQFKLTGDEAIKLTDVLARIRFATGLRPGELIEGSKFFQLRAGLPLGFTGLQGADLSGRLLATLRSYGLEGGIGGRELGGFMLSLNFNTKEKQKTLAELKKTEGIDLKFFDKKGSFLGVENVFSEMEKFRKLSTQSQMKFGEKLFDREGMAIASVFMKSGLEGWRQINERINKVPPLQELINQKTATYNAKLEAVKGTLSNLEATAFTPMLDRLKPLLDLTNQEVGSLQEFTKSHSGVAAIGTDLFAMTGIALTLAGALRAGTTMWGLYSIAAKSAQVQLAGAANEGSRLAGTVNRLAGMKTLTLTVQFLVAGYAIEQILKWKAEYDEQQKTLAEKSAGVSDAYDDAMRSRSLYQAPGKGDKAQYEQLALATLDALKMGRGLEMDLEPDRAAFFEHFWTFQRPYASRWGMQSFDNATRPFSPDIFAEQLRGSANVKPLQDPNVLARFLSQARINMQLSPEGFDLFKQGVEKAMAGVTGTSGKPVFAEALQILNDEARASQQAAQAFNQNLNTWFGPTNQLPGAFQRAADAASRFGSRMDNLQTPTLNFGSPPGLNLPPVGPLTQPNFRFPKSSFEDTGSSRGFGRPVAAVHNHHYGGIQVSLPAGSTAADNPQELARLIAHEVEIRSERV